MGLQMKYFVLKPKGDNQYAFASRQAMRAYANAIDATDKIFADQIIAWVAEEEESKYPPH